MNCPDDPIELDDFTSIRIGRKRWRLARASLRRHGSRGVCLYPKKPRDPGFIVVSTHLPQGGPMRAEAVIHETLHAALPDATEKEVERAARAVTQALQRFGCL